MSSKKHVSLRTMEAKFVELKDAFLDAKKTAGATRSEWLSHLQKLYLEDPHYFEDRVLSILMEAGVEAWNAKPDWKKDPNNPDLFTVAGVEIPDAFSYPCPDVPEKSKQVKGLFASFEQRVASYHHEIARHDAISTKLKGECTKIEDKRREAGGDPQMLLFDLRD